MILLVFVTVFLFRVEAHIKFTECQAEYYRNQPGNENVVFDTDGPPCQKKRNRRGLLSIYHSLRWYNYLKNGKYIVPYFFEEGYENHQFGVVYPENNQSVAINVTEMMEKMEEILDLFKEYTCVEFLRLKTEEEKNQFDYKIMIVHDENKKGTCESWSKLGRLYLNEQPQRLNMCPGAWVWNNKTGLLHEAMHVLGFHHEQTRLDRDDYVEVHPSLTKDSDYAKLTPVSWVNTSSPYDFDSIMQYPSSPVGSDEYTISVPGSYYKTPITANHVFPFSEQDIKQINQAYCPENKSLLEKSLKILTVILTFFSSW